MPGEEGVLTYGVDGERPLGEASPEVVGRYGGGWERGPGVVVCGWCGAPVGGGEAVEGGETGEER